MDFWTIIADLGMPIAAAVACGVFIMIVINYILSSIVGSIDFIKNVIESLDNRIKTMNNDMIKLDVQISEALNLKQDEDRIARADGKTDARKD